MPGGACRWGGQVGRGLDRLRVATFGSSSIAIAAIATICLISAVATRSAKLRKSLLVD
ncbi:hypothetical protein SAMN05519104_8196 [Rhizobiales bacterium GAS188]|nr:hypothetical protein SAMN05519104_8196 [Rhizobiales bacterium GAS188]